MSLENMGACGCCSPGVGPDPAECVACDGELPGTLTLTLFSSADTNYYDQFANLTTCPLADIDGASGPVYYWPSLGAWNTGASDGAYGFFNVFTTRSGIDWIWAVTASLKCVDPVALAVSCPDLYPLEIGVGFFGAPAQYWTETSPGYWEPVYTIPGGGGMGVAAVARFTWYQRFCAALPAATAPSYLQTDLDSGGSPTAPTNNVFDCDGVEFSTGAAYPVNGNALSGGPYWFYPTGPFLSADKFPQLTWSINA